MNLILGLVQLLTVAITARLIGALVVKSLATPRNSFLQISMECACGLLILSYAVYGVVMLPVPNKIGVQLLYGLIVLAAFFECWQWFKKHNERIQLTWKPFWIGFLPLCVLFLWFLLNAILPPSARDELIYHLEVPKRLLGDAGFPLFLDNFYAYFPQLGNMLMLLGMATAGEFAAKLVHWFTGLLLSAALYGYSVDFLKRGNRYLALLLFLTIPSVMVVLPLAYVDLTYSLYAFLALITWFRAHQDGDIRQGVLAAIFVGAAASTKYTGYQWFMILVIASLVFSLIHRQRVSLRLYLVFAAVTGAVGASYLIRNLVMTGWPLYPFQTFSLELNTLLNWSAERAHWYLQWLGTFGAPLGTQEWWQPFAAPVLVFFTGQFNVPSHYEGMLNPIFLIFPFFWKQLSKEKAFVFFFITTGLFFYFWSVTTQQIRFLIPILPVLSLLLVYGIERSKFSKILTVIAILAALISAGVGFQYVWRQDPLPYWKGQETREAYLQRHLPHYAAYRLAEKHLDSEDLLGLINMKNYGYYLSVPWRGDFVFERYSLDKVLLENPTKAAIQGYYRQLQVTHLLYDEAYLASPQWGIETPEGRRAFLAFTRESAREIAREGSFVLLELG